MKGKLIVIEGLDGSGKSTQIKLLEDFLNDRLFKNVFLHYPMMNKGVYGTLIAEYLRGEFGSIESVHPKLVALLFSNDRFEHIDKIINWINEGYYVLCDRYTYSNIAYQCAKIDDSQKESLRDWIYNFEFKEIPKPDKSFFLNVPFNIIKERLGEERIGEDRSYLNGKKDIHEDSLSLQSKVLDEYLKMNDLIKIDCSDDEGYILNPFVINNKILEELNLL